MIAAVEQRIRPMCFLLTPEESFTDSRSGAIATHTHACASRAQVAGWNTTVLARPGDAPPRDDVPTVVFAYPDAPKTRAGVTLRRAERKLRHWTRVCFGEYVDQVERVIRHHDLEDGLLIIHNDPELAVHLRPRLRQSVIVHWFHNQQVCKSRPRRAYSRSVNATIAVSDFTRAWVARWYGLPVDSVRRIHNGVDLQMFYPRRRDSQSERAETPTINFTGRTGREKGCDLLLAAALRLIERHPDLRFRVQIIGANHWGPRTMDAYQSELDALSRSLQQKSVAVTMKGHLSRAETAQAMRQADVHVVPSRWDEPFGLTTVEGMASGLATVASATGGTPEILNGAGLLFDREDVDQLADHLQLLVTEPQRRLAVADACHQRAQSFSWDHTWDQLQKLVTELT